MKNSRTFAGDADGERAGALVSLAAMVNRLATIHHDAAARALDQEGVSASLAGLLWLLEGGDAELNMTDIAHRLACDPSNVTLLAGQLEKQHLAERVPDRQDARRRILRLTPIGRDVARRMIGAVADASPLSSLTTTETAALSATLTAAISSVD